VRSEGKKKKRGTANRESLPGEGRNRGKKKTPREGLTEDNSKGQLERKKRKDNLFEAISRKKSHEKKDPTKG